MNSDSATQGHLRITIAEWCVPLTRMCDPKSRYRRVGGLKDLLEVISDLAQTLDTLRKAGIVHCDITTGNCLAYWDEGKQRWQGKLSDCEYCKPYESKSSGDPTTWTLIFAPVETRAGYSFASASPTPEDLLSLRPSSHNALLPVRYNPFHDLEALYWVTLWLPLNYILVIDKATDTMDEDCLDAWRREVDGIFDSTSSETKGAWLKDSSRLKWNGLVSKLCSWGWSRNVLDLLYPVLMFGPICLCDAYTTLESNLPTEGNEWALSEFTRKPYQTLQYLCLNTKQALESLERKKGAIQTIFVRTLLEEQEERKKKKKAKEEKDRKEAEARVTEERGEKRKIDKVER
ncbi:hypothetical protein BKA70DRAFT_1526127 [Coprinopsis sp. MPI-PUGE-AT-0042]|nr:hypothetical protein BKA70DRAFT_1526127 [Coprinopsis sp. MPI-PUGE-AT-0042]